MPGGTTRSMCRNTPEVNGVVGSSRNFSATATAVIESSQPVLMHVRACREVPDRSTSTSPPRPVTLTRNEVLLVVVETVAVDHVLALVDAVRQLASEGPAHRLGADVA